MTITHRKRLLVAAAALEVILRDLNTARFSCPDCRVSSFENWEEELAHRKLAAEIRRLKELSRAAHPWLDRTVEVPQL